MQEYDLTIIGAGPGGYVAAIRAAQLGMKTAIVEKQYWGGVCLNIGCIPSKCLLEDTHLFHEIKHSGAKRGVITDILGYDWAAMQARKATVVKQLTSGVEGLLKKNGVVRFLGMASFKDAKTVEIPEAGERITSKNFIIATGTVSADLPHIKPDGQVVITSTEALSLPRVPKALAVIGAGAIGLELGSVYARLGTQVTVVEIMPQVIPGADKELADTLARELKKEGMTIHLDSKVVAHETSFGRATLNVEGKFNGVVEAEYVLLAVGRRPFTEGLNLRAAGVEISPRGFIKVDDDLRTNVPHIYAIGDIVGGMLLAHKASHQGIGAVETIAGMGQPAEHEVPSVVYTAPELASVGMTAVQAIGSGHEVKEGKFLVRVNGRAMAMNAISGIVKVVADKRTDALLGVHILGPMAGELIHDAAVGLAAKMKLTEYSSVLRAHPTLAEVITEAALAADSRSIH